MRILDPNTRVTLSAKYEGESYQFEAEIADPSLEIDIDIAIAKRLNGAYLESIRNYTYGYIRATTTLNLVIKEIPENFPIQDLDNFERIRDKEFVIHLFKEYEKKENWFRSELKKNRDTRRSFKRGESLRPSSNDEVSNLPQGSEAPRELLPGTETISNRSDFEGGHSETSKENQSSFPKKAGDENRTRPIPNGFIPDNQNYPGNGSRVFKRDANA
ncbi:hypothetical protein [Leptospira kmetyi]|uniref:hypothetical protein n=1 Tax=Leptospira kmetyi TaxID=408139 RepID=UPI00039061CE|nr:hypothetical protein [Leptospira kmetyi]EQA55374.1 hypothetical protein LEP1GSC052_0034 [Leptospira kmetyi serovar Malaysia str. Bejo-Iso9]